MEVKGVAIRSNIIFFREKYGDYYSDFLKMLDNDVKKIYSGDIDIREWYEIQRFYLDPMAFFAHVVNASDPIAFAREIGEYSASVTLTGVYKVFLLVATPKYILRKSSRLMKTFYNEAEAEAMEEGPNWFRLRILRFPKLNKMLEHRICAYSRRALELAHAKNVSYTIEKSITNGDQHSIILFSWD